MRLYSFLAIFLCLLCVTACNNKETSTTPSTDTKTSTKATKSSDSATNNNTNSNTTSEPVIAAGPYLVCSRQKNIYCGLQNANYQSAAIPSKPVGFKAVLTDNSSLTINPTLVTGSQSWYWQISSTLNNSNLTANNFANLLSLEMLEDGNSLQTGSLKVSFSSHPTVCSQSGGETVSVTFSNKCSYPVDLVWIDFSCSPKTYGTIQPGTTSSLKTYVTHIWNIVITSTGLVMESFTVKSYPGTYTYETCKS